MELDKAKLILPASLSSANNSLLPLSWLWLGDSYSCPTIHFFSWRGTALTTDELNCRGMRGLAVLLRYHSGRGPSLWRNLFNMMQCTYNIPLHVTHSLPSYTIHIMHVPSHNLPLLIQNVLVHHCTHDSTSNSHKLQFFASHKPQPSHLCCITHSLHLYFTSLTACSVLVRSNNIFRND